MERMNMNQLRSLAKGRNLRGYSRLRKADLINFLCENEPSPPPRPESSPVEQGPIDQPQINDKTINLTKSQLKRRSQKASKLKKKSKSLRTEIHELKSQNDSLEDQIKKATKSTSAIFKGKKIRSMKREATKLNERIQEKTKELKVQMKCFFLFPNLKEQQKSGRLPFTIS